jgi:hypothetical protein
MRLDARDWDPSIFRGSGEIRVTTPTTFTYTLDGTPNDVGHTLHCLTPQRDNSYDGLMRFRLNVVDDTRHSPATGERPALVGSCQSRQHVLVGCCRPVSGHPPRSLLIL